MESKQAYLIIAHKDDLTFRTLISMLDYKYNDIFIHMDKKNKNYDERVIEELVTQCKVYHTNRTNVMWGGYSLINAEMILLPKATETGKYQHYHLLSGEDLPIQKQEIIQKFFEEQAGKEFVAFDQEEFHFNDQVCYRYFFQEKIGRRKGILWKIQKILIESQRLLAIKRNRKIRFQKGTNWFSITDELARYVIEKKDWIKKTFKNSYCADEIFLQTIIFNSYFIHNLYYNGYDDQGKSTMRFIDWERGYPYIFRNEDLVSLKNSRLLFARKFDCNMDRNIIKQIQDLNGIQNIVH